MKRPLVALALSCLGLFGVAAIVGAAVASDDMPEKPPYAQNESGTTYGKLPTDRVDDPAEYPDLIGVQGEGGVEGYAYASDLFGDPTVPSDPAAALERNVLTHYIPVYEADGKTVIGRFKVSAGMGPKEARDAGTRN